jgi:hypothetical protein
MHALSHAELADGHPASALKALRHFSNRRLRDEYNRDLLLTQRARSYLTLAEFAEDEG